MLPRRLLVAVLGVPLAAGFDVEELSNLLNILPDEVASPCLVVRDLLVAYPALHFDQAPRKEWGLAELELFIDQYLPALQDLLTATAYYPQLVYEAQNLAPPEQLPPALLVRPAQPQLAPLGQMLRHLLCFRASGSSELGVSLAPDGSVISLGMAHAKFGALRCLWNSFFRLLPRSDLEVRNAPQLPLEVPLLRPALEIRSMITFAGKVAQDLGLIAETPGCPLVLEAMGREDGGDGMFVREWLAGAEGRLLQLFAELQAAVARLKGLQLASSWLLFELFSWLDICSQDRLSDAKPKGTAAAVGITAKLPEFAGMLKRFNARVCVLSTMLRLEAPRFPEKNAQVSSTLTNDLTDFLRYQDKYYGLLPKAEAFLAKPSDSFQEFMKTVGILNARYKDKSEVFMRCASHLATLSDALLEGRYDGSWLRDDENLRILGQVYALARRVVEAYERLLIVGKPITEKVDRLIRFLLNFFARTHGAAILTSVKTIMDCAYPLLPEASRGAEYDWFNFPLRTILPFQATSNKSARNA